MSTPPLVIVSHTLPEAWLAPLKEQCRLLVGPQTTTLTSLAPGLYGRLAEADALLSLLTLQVDETLLARAPRLKVISNMATGVDNIELAACTRRGIPVGHTPGVLAESTAELTMALLLAAARGLPQASADARSGRWITWEPARWLGRDLHGATLGILGLGQIGTEVARRAHAFGMKLLYHNRQPRPETAAPLGAAYVSLNDLLAESDFISLHLPLNSKTRHLINKDALQRMKPSAILINMARGPIVDTDALYRGLRQGWLAAAALDVTDPEPLPAGHPLYDLPNCLIVPHIGSATHQTRRRMAELACENVLAGLAGQPLPHCANPEVYD